MMFTKENLNRDRLYYYLLDNLHIDLDKWGTGESKSFDSLALEIENGECTVDACGVRRAGVVLADVICEDVRLIEKRQVFSDGRERIRKLPFGSLGEKLFTGEDCFAGLVRMFREEVKVELSQKYGHFWVKGPGYIQSHRPSPSYPGLITAAEELRFTLHIDQRFRRALGQDEVVSIEENKTTYLLWEKIR
jgi:hypothetical protein